MCVRVQLSMEVHISKVQSASSSCNFICMKESLTSKRRLRPGLQKTDGQGRAGHGRISVPGCGRGGSHSCSQGAFALLLHCPLLCLVCKARRLGRFFCCSLLCLFSFSGLLLSFLCNSNGAFTDVPHATCCMGPPCTRRCATTMKRTQAFRMLCNAAMCRMLSEGCETIQAFSLMYFLR